MSDFLLEIGCENLPPHAIPQAFAQLGSEASRRLEELRLRYDSITATGAPRRLVLMVSGLASVQSARTETVTGPPRARAFDEHGRPTAAAVGFAKAQGIEPERLEIIETARGGYVGFRRKLARQRASRLLATLVPELVTAIRWPKVMHWQSGGIRFARPIRWLVCMLDDKVVPLSLAGVRSGKTTYTTPWIQRRPITIAHARDYRRTMKRAGVIVEDEARARHIESQARKAAAREGLELVEDAELVNELTFMLENPRPLVGRFDEGYLVLPPEVVTTAMRAHQRYFALRKGRGGIVPRFLTFTEGRVGSPARVRAGNEKVLRARLEDALFYWREDLKKGIEALAGELDRVVFIEGLGTLADKAIRVDRIARAVAEAIPDATVDGEQRGRAARLAKADLASEMIKDGKEFTQLQGLVASHYAREAREPDEVVAALREQYRPRTPSDGLPESPLGTVLGIADRIDTITGCFLAGLVPSGSQDPYGLRRLANGLLRMLDGRPQVAIDALLQVALDAYADGGLGVELDRTDAATAATRLTEFFRARTALYLRDAGVDHDVVNAVTAAVWQNPGIALRRARVIQNLRSDEALELLVTGAKRVSNILADDMKRFGADWPDLSRMFPDTGVPSEEAGFDPSTFEDQAERTLYQDVTRILPVLRHHESAGDEVAMLKTLSTLGPPIDSYFDRVLVNCPDKSQRAQRHRFLASIFALFAKYADLSYIVEPGGVPVA